MDVIRNYLSGVSGWKGQKDKLRALVIAKEAEGGLTERGTNY